MQLALWNDVPRSSKRPLRDERKTLKRVERDARSDSLALALPALADTADRYVRAAHADATRKAYQTDWRGFETWCTQMHLTALPATTRTLELYLAHLASLGRKASTIRRARKAIGLAHGYEGLERPDQHARIRALERGVGRLHGAREEGAAPLLNVELAAAVRGLGNSPRELRDRALLLVGFGGALRCSELAGLDVAHVRFTDAGVELFVHRSKEDQLGKGEHTFIPHGSTDNTCPVNALRRWLECVARPRGPLFRVIRGAQIEHERMHPRAVTRAVQRCVARAHLEGAYSSHSLRSGLATAAYANGASRREIQLQGRWKDPRSVDRYIKLEYVRERQSVVQGLL